MKLVYTFGGGRAEGRASMSDILGGKGANLAEMARLKLPVPAGFTVATTVCRYYSSHKRTYPSTLEREVLKAVAHVERIMRCRFADPSNPLLLSVRSGARRSMPGMMETVLNVGLSEKVCEGLIRRTDNPRFVYDAYRRLIQMYADVVMEKAVGREPADGVGIRALLEERLHALKTARGVKLDTELNGDDLRNLVADYKTLVREKVGKPFPDDPLDQLWGAMGAVFASWNGKRAVAYRRIEHIPDEWGTAVNVQAMVFGNVNDQSATGVAFTRNPATGAKYFYGEWLVNAQGEDVVAGIRTPNPMNEVGKTSHTAHLLSLEKAMPAVYRNLSKTAKTLERHYRDMLDMEFTIQEGRLWILQCRVGKRNGRAAVKMAVDMVRERLIPAEEALLRVSPDQLEELLHPVIDPSAEEKQSPIAKGLPAGPGGATGQVVFSSHDAVQWTHSGKTVILVREETNPEDVEGMRAAVGILTVRGGLTSHAALVARGWGKCCIVGAGDIKIQTGQLMADGITLHEGDWITINGTTGSVYKGALPLVKTTEDNPEFNAFMKLADKVRRMKIRTNADTPEDAAQARAFGAEGIGLFRTEHMFYGRHSEKPLFLLRKMIVAATTDERRIALDELFEYVKSDIQSTLEAMDGYPVTIRTLDPPLHEFVPRHDEERMKLAERLGMAPDELRRRADELAESNPMMGHRGVRLGITYPEVTEMQIRAIFEATAELLRRGKKAFPEIMIPVVATQSELTHQKHLVANVYRETCEKFRLKKIPYLFGTMIETPRACLVADELASEAQFFSFGTNDLTQLTFAYSRDDVGKFLPAYLKANLLDQDPFKSMDRNGVGRLVHMAVARGRQKQRNLKVGICGEHGGDPKSVEFCDGIGLDYVSCSPFRVPVARLAAAQAVARKKLNK